MMFDDALITRIVEGVLAELSTPTAGVRDEANSSNSPSVPENSSTANSSSPPFKGGARGGNEQPATSNSSQPTAEPRHIADSVITAEILEASLNGNRRVVFGKKAVLTPSAREFLKKHNIEWTHGSGTNGKPAATAATWKAFVVHSTPALESAAAEVARQPASFVRELSGSTKEATDAAVSAVCKAEATGAIVVTREPAAAACRANRNSRVRAAVVRDVTEIEQARRELGANVVCLDATDRSHFELRNLLRAIAAGPAPRLPEGWSE